MQLISIFDLDRTVTRNATFGPFLIMAARQKPLRFLALPAIILASFGYFLGLVGRGRLKEINLGLVLGQRIDRQYLRRLSQEFARGTVRGNCPAGAVARIKSDRAEGRRVVIATASFAYYAAEIGKELEIADVIGTKCVETEGFLLPVIDGENCYGPAKLSMVQSWLESESIAREAAHIRFYSDHVSDAPCMIWADEAYATNAHRPLVRLANARGWKIFDWH